MSFNDLRYLLAKTPWPGDISVPSWDDLALGGLPSDETALDLLIDRLQTGPVVIAAPPNHGKTFLAYQTGRRIADRFDKRPTSVSFAPANTLNYGASVAEIVRQRTLLGDNPQEDTRLRYVYIVDDCHLNEEVSEALVKLSSPPTLTFLCTIRASSVASLPAWASDLHEGDPDRIVFRRYDPRLAEAIARSFIHRTKHTRQTAAALTAFAATLGGDLSRIVFGLRAWAADTSVPLEQINEASIVTFTRREFAIDELDPLRARVLHLLATFGNLEFNVPRKWIPDQLLSSLSALVDDGLARFDGAFPGGYTLMDQKTCGWVLKALARFCESLSLPSEPVLMAECCARGSPDTGLSLLTRLVSARRIDLARSVLLDKKAVAHISKAFEKYGAKKLARKLSLLYPGLQGSDRRLVGRLVGRHAEKVLTTELPGAPPNRVCDAVKTFGALGVVRGAFASWTETDWLRTINSSTFAALRRLTFELHGFRADQVIKKLAASLPKADVEALVARGPLGRQGLAGFVGNIAQDAPAAVGPFLFRLLQADFGGAIERAVPKEVNELLHCFRKFASQELSRAFLTRVKPVLAGVREREPSFDSFWLLWNIFRIDKAMAGEQAVSVAMPAPGDPAYLPLGGLLGLCGQPVRALTFPAAEELSVRLSEEPSSTVFGVTLQSLLFAGAIGYAKAVVHGLEPDAVARLEADTDPFMRQLVLDGLRQIRSAS